MRHAYRSGDYTMKQIGAYFGYHCATCDSQPSDTQTGAARCVVMQGLTLVFLTLVFSLKRVQAVDHAS